MTQDNIEEVKKILEKSFTRGRIDGECYEEWCEEIATQISQLFPQHITDEGLRETVAREFYKARVLAGDMPFSQAVAVRSVMADLAYASADKILTLLPQRVEEVVIQARKEQMVIDWAQAGRDVEEAKKQERERILALYENMGCVPEDDNCWYDFWQALSGDKDEDET